MLSFPDLTPAPRFDGPLFLVFNRQSGKGESADVAQAVQQACAAQGRPVKLYEARKGKDLPELARQAALQAHAQGGVLVAAGGDGTINLVAQMALSAQVPLGVLPQGTFNYFSRTHGISAEADEALRVVLTGQPQAVQVGHVNGQAFLVNASVGLYVALIADREKAKARHGRSRMVALLAALGTLWRGARVWDVALQTPSGWQRLQTSTVFVGNSALQLNQVGVPEADQVAGGVLAAVCLQPMGRLAMLGLAARAALGRLVEAEAVQSFAFDELQLVPLRAHSGLKVKVAIDGEIHKMQFPLRFSVAPQGLWLMKPTPEQMAQHEAPAQGVLGQVLESVMGKLDGGKA